MTMPFNWIHRLYRNENDYLNQANPDVSKLLCKKNEILFDMYDQVIRKRNDLDYRLTSVECHARKNIAITDAMAIAIPINFREEFQKINNHYKGKVIYYCDKLEEGNLPGDLLSVSLDLFQNCRN